MYDYVRIFTRILEALARISFVDFEIMIYYSGNPQKEISRKSISAFGVARIHAVDRRILER
jgi:hypothetical protein